jgi:hypothetical protein
MIAFDPKKIVRDFVASIGYPVGAFSRGGLDEAALIKVLENVYERGRLDEREAQDDYTRKIGQRS